ncbi:hypothetical protein BGZ54_010355 [Gamsiella multidivaricata]|nr:hypothetical protein BGZ54_010355 [Gamsiella multidivaricata]
MSITIPDDVCWIPEEGVSRIDTQFVSAAPDLSLKLDIVDNIESDDATDESIRIRVVLRAASTELLRELTQTLTRDGAQSVFSRIHLRDSNDKETKKRLMRHNSCALANVEITYPRARPGTGKLDVKVADGELVMSMDPNSIEATFEEVHFAVSNGGVNVETAVVSKGFFAKVANGRIRAVNLRSAGRIEAETLNGRVEMTVDTKPLHKDWDPENLMILLTTLNGDIDLNLVQRFWGHFELVTQFGKKSIRLPDNSTDIIKYTTPKRDEIQGWVSADGTEPRNVVPRFDLSTVNGAIDVRFESQKK